MQEKLIEKIALDNGLTLELWDRSRQVAGDRWLVCFVARVTVPVEQKYFKQENDESLTIERVRNVVGEQAVYMRQKESHFVDVKEKDGVFETLKNTFLDTNLGYISGPDFPQKLIMKTYREIQERGYRKPV